MIKTFDCQVLHKIHWWERFLLLFVKPHYAYDTDGYIMCQTKSKRLFGKIYVLEQNCRIKRLGEMVMDNDKTK